MDYWSILVAALLGALGGGLGHWIVSKFSKNKQLSSMGGVVIAILFYQVLHPIVYDNYMKPMVEKSKINKILNHVVEVNRPLLPRMLDEVTRQDTIEATDLKLKYGYTIVNVKIDKNQFEENLDEIKKSVQSNSCKDKGSKGLILHGVTLVFSYKLENKPDIFSFEIDNCE